MATLLCKTCKKERLFAQFRKQDVVKKKGKIVAKKDRKPECIICVPEEFVLPDWEPWLETTFSDHCADLARIDGHPWTGAGPSKGIEFKDGNFTWKRIKEQVAVNQAQICCKKNDEYYFDKIRAPSEFGIVRRGLGFPRFDHGFYQ